NAKQRPSDNGGILRISDAKAAFLHIIDTSRLLTALRNDKRAIFEAAREAQNAADYLLAMMTDQAD
ncbi:antirestriction protein ArdC, partial [Sphingomonas yabuuchiae]|nr:antirestriction protein ArdC [Sphingomonas yabuuchiae]